MELDIASRQASGYTVQTPVYEGPLDLLLRLIERAELDITIIALANVTDQYLSYIRENDLPADEISAFLLIAAKLLQIKSEALLPRPPVREADEEDPGEALARQLLLYKQFKEVALKLDERQNMSLRTYLSLAPSPKIEGRLDLSDVTVADLLSAAEAILSREQEKQSLGMVITAPRFTIRDKITLIAERLAQSKSSSFGALFGEKPSRLEVVVTFLALLELVKRYRVLALQESLFGEIAIERMEEWDQDEDLEIEFE